MLTAAFALKHNSFYNLNSNGTEECLRINIFSLFCNRKKSKFNKVSASRTQLYRLTLFELASNEWNIMNDIYTL